jgi:hypothetical protein
MGNWHNTLSPFTPIAEFNSIASRQSNQSLVKCMATDLTSELEASPCLHGDTVLTSTELSFCMTPAAIASKLQQPVIYTAFDANT